MLDKLSEIEKTALESLAHVRDETSLESWRVAHLGRSSQLMTWFSDLGDLSKDERPSAGQAANRVKSSMESAMQKQKVCLLTSSIKDKCSFCRKRPRSILASAPSSWTASRTS